MQLPRFNSLHHNPYTEAVEALAQNNWNQEMNFCNLPFWMIPQVLQKNKESRSRSNNSCAIMASAGLVQNISSNVNHATSATETVKSNCVDTKSKSDARAIKKQEVEGMLGEYLERKTYNSRLVLECSKVFYRELGSINGDNI